MVYKSVKFYESIKLTSPFPWCSQSGKTGFVVEISQDCLHLELFKAEERLGKYEKLTVNLPYDGGYALVLEGEVLESGEAKRQSLVVTDCELLKDLLGKVRKDQHIEICRSQDVESSQRFTGLEMVRFIPDALPELNEEDLDTKVNFLGRDFSFPMMITGMTGGIAKGRDINIRLARIASHYGIPMGIGSQRLALDNPQHSDIFSVKRHVSDLFLVGNVGCAQLRSSDATELCRRAIDMIEADALAIHLNVIQESIQVEGDKHFSGLLSTIEQVCKRLSLPIIVKEVGCGISVEVARRLVEAGVSAIDIGGRGGTSWGYIEGLRSTSEVTQTLGHVYRDWGIPTAFSLSAVRRAYPKLPLIATGGMRTGLDIAKASALGANIVGVGLPLLRAALESEEAISQVVDTLERGLRIAMIATGSGKLRDLSGHLCYGEPYEDTFKSHVLELNSRT